MASKYHCALSLGFFKCAFFLFPQFLPIVRHISPSPCHPPHCSLLLSSPLPPLPPALSPLGFPVLPPFQAFQLSFHLLVHILPWSSSPPVALTHQVCLDVKSGSEWALTPARWCQAHQRSTPGSSDPFVDQVLYYSIASRSLYTALKTFIQTKCPNILVDSPSSKYEQVILNNSTLSCTWMKPVTP